MEKILLLESVSKHADMIRIHLEKQNFDVTVSDSIDKTKEFLAKQLPDIMVIDLNMADKDFFDFYRWMQKIEEVSRIPRLFIAGKMQTEMALKLEKEYKETVLSKPLDINRFTSTLTQLKSKKSPIIRKNRAQDYFSSLIGRKIGPAKIIEEIGRGGMGAVFMGYQESLDRHVSIKILLPEMVGDSTAIERFQREALAIAKIKSPHIVQIYDFGEFEDNAFYICMEYLKGITVERYLKRNGSFPLEKAVSVITQVAAGLSVAHDAGLIHRDIKPSNLIMNNKGHVTITDFGLVRPKRKLMQHPGGMIMGSPHYMAPEQASEVELDARSDIYSLGIVFFHLIAGHPPYLSSNPVEILIKHLNEPLPDLRVTLPEIPGGIVDIMERMTAKDPVDRYINCRELLWDLKAQERKFAAAPSGHGLHAYQDPDYPDENLNNITIDTSFHPIFTELTKQFPAIFSQENLMGTMTLSETGGMMTSKGKFPEEWKNTLFILQESAKQLNAAVKLGQWKFKLVETQEEVLALFPQSYKLGSMLFNQGDTGTFSNALLKSTGTGFTGDKQSQDPLQQIASISGVVDILLLNKEGQLTNYFLKNPRVLDEYKSRFIPVAQIFHSFSVKITAMDLWFDKGRILAWFLESGILFVIASLDTSRSFLSIYIAAHMEQLKAAVNSKNTPSPVLIQEIQVPDEKEKTSEKTSNTGLKLKFVIFNFFLSIIMVGSIIYFSNVSKENIGQLILTGALIVGASILLSFLFSYFFEKRGLRPRVGK